MQPVFLFLLAIGNWVRSNGEGIYGSRPWTHMREGSNKPAEPPGDWKGGSTAHAGSSIKRPDRIPITEADSRFTTANNNLYAFGYKYPQAETDPRPSSAPSPHPRQR